MLALRISTLLYNTHIKPKISQELASIQYEMDVTSKILLFSFLGLPSCFTYQLILPSFSY